MARISRSSIQKKLRQGSSLTGLEPLAQIAPCQAPLARTPGASRWACDELRYTVQEGAEEPFATEHRADFAGRGARVHLREDSTLEFRFEGAPLPFNLRRRDYWAQRAAVRKASPARTRRDAVVRSTGSRHKDGEMHEG
jgi:hypothetical protein